MALMFLGRVEIIPILATIASIIPIKVQDQLKNP